MKRTKLTLICGGFLLLATLVNAEDKSIDKDRFLRINPNITNEALRAELNNLVVEFEAERKHIQSYYTREIDALKEKRRLDIKSIKNEFGEKREALFIKYGEGRKKTKPAINPNKIKKERGRKKLRKSK